MPWPSKKNCNSHGDKDTIFLQKQLCSIRKYQACSKLQQGMCKINLNAGWNWITHLTFNLQSVKCLQQGFLLPSKAEWVDTISEIL